MNVAGIILMILRYNFILKNNLYFNFLFQVFSMNESKVESMEPYLLFYNKIPSSTNNFQTMLQSQKTDCYSSGKRPCFSSFSIAKPQNRLSLPSEKFQPKIIGPVLPSHLTSSKLNGSSNTPKLNGYSKLNNNGLSSSSNSTPSQQRFTSSSYSCSITR